MLVRQATLDDRPEVFDLIRIAFAGRERYKIPERWQWQFCDNPFWSGPRLPIWIALDGDRVIGQTGAMIEPIKLGSTATTVAWSVDTYVLPEYRGQGVGHRLQQANQNHHRVFMSLAMSAPNRSIKASLGGRTLPGMQVFELRRVLPSALVAERTRRRIGRLSQVAGSMGVNRVVAEAVTRSARWQWRWRSDGIRRSLRGLTATEVVRFDARLDEFWSRQRGRYDVAVERTAEYLNWKFCDQPHAAYRRWIVERSGCVAGYFVLRAPEDNEPPIGIIADVLAAPDCPTGIAGLVVLAVDVLDDSRVEKVRLGTSQAEAAASFRRLGFRPTRSYVPMCHAEGLPIPDHAATLFGLADHDLDQFPTRK